MYPSLHWDPGIIVFGVYPYIALTILIAASVYRYVKSPATWNSRSSQILEKKVLQYGSVLWHYGIVLALFGHVFGLLVPQTFYNWIGFKESYHEALARWSGMVFGWMALIGLLGLTWRRLSLARIYKNSTLPDILILFLLLILVGLGTYNVTFVNYKNTLHDIAPWLRSIFAIAPAPDLVASVPWTYKAHFIAGFALFAAYPFTRLIHITSAPINYLGRVYIIFWRRCLWNPRKTTLG